MQDRDPLKFINHMRKIIGLPRPNRDWFQAALSLFGLKDLCMTSYITISHKMFNAFLERWHLETSSFYLPLGEMFITLDDISCFLHLSIRGRLLDHGRIIKDEALEIIVDYLGADSEEAKKELYRTRKRYI